MSDWPPADGEWIGADVLFKPPDRKSEVWGIVQAEEGTFLKVRPAQGVVRGIDWVRKKDVKPYKAKG